jgi:hypothetical protein
MIARWDATAARAARSRAGQVGGCSPAGGETCPLVGIRGVVDQAPRAAEPRRGDRSERAAEVVGVQAAVRLRRALRVRGLCKRADRGELRVPVSSRPVGQVHQEADLSSCGVQQLMDVGGGRQQRHPVLGDHSYRRPGGEAAQASGALLQEFGGGVGLAGDHPGSGCPEGAGILEPAGDPCLVLIGVGGMDEVSGVDEEGVEGDVRVGQRRAQLGEVGSAAARKMEVAQLSGVLRLPPFAARATAMAILTRFMPIPTSASRSAGSGASE